MRPFFYFHVGLCNILPHNSKAEQLKSPNKDNNTNYLKILDEMYKNNKTLQEISTLMNVSENDIVDILFEMSEYADKVIQVWIVQNVIHN